MRGVGGSGGKAGRSGEVASRVRGVRSTVGRLGRLAAGLVVFGVVGCVSRGDPGIVSETPRITQAPLDAMDLQPFLATEEDLDAVGMSDVVVGDLDDLAMYENPDPRGPCGGVVPEFRLEGAAGRSFRAAEHSAFALVMHSDDELERYLATLQADVAPSCGPYRSRTNTGGTQGVDGIEIVDLDIPGVNSIAWTSTITAGGASVESAFVMLVGDERAAVVHVSGLYALSPGQVEDLARRAAARLDG